jgi:hypothetical protein
MYSLVFRCWAVLLSFCLVSSPLYAQVRDSALNIAGKRIPAPARSSDQAAQATSSPRDSAETGIVDPDADAEEIRLNSNAASVQIDSAVNPLSGDARNEPVLQQSDRELIAKNYAQGKNDGKRDSRGKPLWILAGLSGTGLCVCFGVAGIGIALAVPYYPPPPGEMLLGKSTAYVEGYYEGYSSKIRLKNAAWATLGFVIAVVIDLALNKAITFGNIHVDMD